VAFRHMVKYRWIAYPRNLVSNLLHSSIRALEGEHLRLLARVLLPQGNTMNTSTPNIYHHAVMGFIHPDMDNRPKVPISHTSTREVLCKSRSVPPAILISNPHQIKEPIHPDNGCVLSYDHNLSTYQTPASSLSSALRLGWMI